MMNSHLQATALLFALSLYASTVAPAIQKTSAHRRAAHPPSREQNQQLLKSLDEYIQQTHRALLSHQSDILLGLTLSAWNFSQSEDINQTSARNGRIQHISER